MGCGASSDTTFPTAKDLDVRCQRLKQYRAGKAATLNEALEIHREIETKLEPLMEHLTEDEVLQLRSIHSKRAIDKLRSSKKAVLNSVADPADPRHMEEYSVVTESMDPTSLELLQDESRPISISSSHELARLRREALTPQLTVSSPAAPQLATDGLLSPEASLLEGSLLQQCSTSHFFDMPPPQIQVQSHFSTADDDRALLSPSNCPASSMFESNSLPIFAVLDTFDEEAGRANRVSGGSAVTDSMMRPVPPLLSEAEDFSPSSSGLMVRILSIPELSHASVSPQTSILSCCEGAPLSDNAVRGKPKSILRGLHRGDSFRSDCQQNGSTATSSATSATLAAPRNLSRSSSPHEGMDDLLSSSSIGSSGKSLLSISRVRFALPIGDDDELAGSLGSNRKLRRRR